MLNLKLKILSDVQCDVYIDGVYHSIADSNVVHVIPLTKGEYWVQLISTLNPQYCIENIILLEYDKIFKVEFSKLIDSHSNLAVDSEIVYLPENKCYENVLTGKRITSQDIDQGRPFLNGLAIINKNGYWGKINRLGEIVVPCEYLDETFLSKYLFDLTDLYDGFDCISEGLVGVAKNGKLGFLDIKGNEIVQLIYDDSYRFYDGSVGVKKYGKWGLINKSGKQILPFIYDDFIDYYNGCAGVVRGYQWGMIDKSGNEIVECKYDFDSNYDQIFIYKFHYNYIRVRLGDYLGLLNTEGKEILPCVYDKIVLLNEGTVIVGYNNKEGVIDLTNNGKEVLPIVYDSIKHIDSTHVYLVSKDNKYGYINDAGKFLLPCEYDLPLESEDFTRTYKVFAVSKNETTYIYDINFNEIASIRDIKKVYSIRDGLICARKGNFIGLIDFSDNIIIPFEYQLDSELWGFDDIRFCCELAEVRKNDKWGYINKSGKTVIPFIYDLAYSFVDGKAIVMNGNAWKGYKYGLIDLNGTTILPIMYDGLSRLGKHLFKAKIGEKYGILNLNGDIVISFAYNEIDYIQDRFIKVVKDNLWGILDMRGNFISQCVYEITCDKCHFEARHLLNETYLKVKKDGKWGIINNDGTVIVDFIYDEISKSKLKLCTNEFPCDEINKYLIEVKIDGKTGLLYSPFDS